MTVIRLADLDRLDSIDPPGRWTRLRDRLFGTAAPHRLADEALEALRRLVVRLRHSPNARDAKHEIEAAIASGFSHAQVTALIARNVEDAPR